MGLISGFGITRRGVSLPHLMHAADWLPTLAMATGVPLVGSLPLDGVSQWEALSASKAVAAGGLNGGSVGVGGSIVSVGAEHWPPAARTFVVLGNATDMCEPEQLKSPEAREEEEEEDEEERLGVAKPGQVGKRPVGGMEAGDEGKQGLAPKTAPQVGCGFAIRLDDTSTSARWKLIRGYGGEPDTWCNASAGHHASCDNAAMPPPGANGSASMCHQHVSRAGAASDTHASPMESSVRSAGARSAGGDSHCLYELSSDPHERSELTGAPSLTPPLAKA